MAGWLAGWQSDPIVRFAKIWWECASLFVFRLDVLCGREALKFEARHKLWLCASLMGKPVLRIHVFGIMHVVDRYVPGWCQSSW